VANRINVAVLFGGRSTEHEISVITGLEVLASFDATHYNAFPVYIDQRGKWFYGKELLQKDVYKNLPSSLESLKEVALLPAPNTGGLSVIGGKKGFSLFNSKLEVIPVDVYFPAFHGSLGEDGCIQGLFELADVPYTGCGVPASAVAMNKGFCKAIVEKHGVPVLPGIVVKKSEAQKSIAGVREKILASEGLKQFPLFVKPVNLGSSIGVSVAKDAPGLDAALAKAFQFDSEALVEPCVTNKLEVNVSVRDCPEALASVTETPVASGELLSYEDKYLRGRKNKTGSTSQPKGMASLVRVIDPADLEQSIKDGVTKHALTAYRVLGCTGIVRFDFMINLDGDKLYFNELNPLPGSLAHYLWEKSKPAQLYPEILHDQVQTALMRHELRAGLQRDVGFKALNG